MKEEYISKEQFCKECHVGKQTALWLIQSGLLPAINTMRQTGRYLIAKSDIACYLRNRELEPEKYRYRKYRCQSFQNPGVCPGESVRDLRSALEKIWTQVPDVLRCHEVQALLGYEEGVIARWRKELGLGYIKVSQTIYYPKKYLIDFLLSPQSQAQYIRSNKHIQLLRRIKNVENRVVSVTNQKGGVGKTSSALNLGAALNISGMKVLVVDNDPQGNLTAALGYTPAEQSRTLANLLLAAIDYPEDLELHLGRTIIHTNSGLDLLPANRRLAAAAARLQVMQLSQYNAVGELDRACEKVMATLLEPLKSQYDYIIIGCGLKHELLTVNALAASDYCIIPVQAHFLASEGIPDVLGLVKSVQAKFNPDLKIAGILLTMYQSRPQLCQSVKASVFEVYGEDFHVFQRPIEYSIKVAECPAAGQSIFEYAPKNAAAESYRSLAEEVLALG